jgi:hypothetical protein
LHLPGNRTKDFPVQQNGTLDPVRRTPNGQSPGSISPKKLGFHGKVRWPATSCRRAADSQGVEVLSALRQRGEVRAAAVSLR